MEQPSLEIELRRDLQDLQHWVISSNRMDAGSSRAEKRCDEKGKFWDARLSSEQAAEIKTADVADHPAIGERYDRLQRGTVQAIDAIRQGKDADLSFTLSERSYPEIEEPTPQKVVTGRDRLAQLRSGQADRTRDDLER